MPVLPRRAVSSSLPTLLSLSKLLHHIPRSTSFKRGAEWAVTLAEKPVEPEDPPDSPKFWWKLGLSVVLVLAGGVFAGLTLALMGSDDLNLRVLSTSSDDPKERKAAAKVLRLLGRGRHWVLVVLLLGNVIVNESLPIFLDDVLGGGVAAVIVSTTMIVIFGEIIPQAVCVRYGLSIGGVCAPLVLGLMIFFAPIAWPIAKLLDYVLGSETGNTYKKAELKSFLQFHREGEEPLRDDEIGILNGVLSLNDKEVKQIMTPIKDCLTLPSDKILDHEAIDQILLSGFSRLPIHEPGQRDNFIGMLLVKRLITYSPEDEWPVSKFPLLPLPEARPDINCFQALDYFQTGRAHLLLISDTPGRRGGAIGIVSLEDLIEEIIGEEIVDETDRYQDNRSHKVAKRAGTAAVMRGIIERQRVIGALSRRPSDTGSNPPPATGPGPAGDGLLIQIHDGNMVAEPVSVGENQEAGLSRDGRRLVVNPASDRMESIEEASSVGQSPSIVPHGANGVKREGVEAEVGGEIEDDGQGDGGRLKVPDNKDLLGSLDDDEDEQDELAVASGLAYSSHVEFERAAKEFVDKYKDANGDVIGPGRTNKGWEWKEATNKWSKGGGYLCRKLTRHVKLSKDETEVIGVDQDESHGLEDEEDNHATETTRLISTHQAGSNGNGPDHVSDNGQGTMSKSKKKRMKKKNKQTATPPSEGQAPAQSALKTDKDKEQGAVKQNERTERIEVEQHIVYSKTYHVPQLLIRAWNSNGAPLSLPDLLKYRIIHSGAHLPEGTNGALPDRPDALMLDPHSPFPLLQQLEHPMTGDVVWSVHPCQVGEAVEEVLGAERAEKGDAEHAKEAKKDGEEQDGQTSKREEEIVEENPEERGLRWLETWMMLSSGVVDLST